MLKAKFSYDVPTFGAIEIEGNTDNWTNEMIHEEIEKSYPEAVDIEILKVEHING